MATFGKIGSNISIGAGQSIRRNAEDTAYEAYTPSTGSVDMETVREYVQTIARSVLDYGAVGDGETDCTDAFQDAIDAAFTAGGGHVWVPAGLYMVDNIVLKENVYLFGVPGDYTSGSRIKRAATSNTSLPLIDVSGTAYGDENHIKNSGIIGMVVHNSDMAGTAIRSFYSKKLHFRDVFTIGAVSGHGFHGVEFWDTDFVGCRWEYCGDATHAAVLLQNTTTSDDQMFGYSADNCNHILFDWCTWESIASTGVDLDSTSNGSTEWINNIYFKNLKFESWQFSAPFINVGQNAHAIFASTLYFHAGGIYQGYSGGPKPFVILDGVYATFKDIFATQGAANLVHSAIYVTGNGGENCNIENVQGQWNTFEPSSGATVYVHTDANPPLVIRNVQTNAGQAVIDDSDIARFERVPFQVLENDTLDQDYKNNEITQLTVTANRTLVTSIPPAGSRAVTKIVTSGTTSRTITFGSGFKPTGTLATGTSSGKVFMVSWISDGSYLYETGRTSAI